MKHINWQIFQTKCSWHLSCLCFHVLLYYESKTGQKISCDCTAAVCFQIRHKSAKKNVRNLWARACMSRKYRNTWRYSPFFFPTATAEWFKTRVIIKPHCLYTWHYCWLAIFDKCWIILANLGKDLHSFFFFFCLHSSLNWKSFQRELKESRAGKKCEKTIQCSHRHSHLILD